MARTSNHEAGYTLLELLIVISIFVTASFALATFVTQGFRVNRFAQEQSDEIAHAHKGVETLAREIREASFAENGDFPLVEANAQSLTFSTDLDSDKAVEKVRYFLAGTDFKKGTTEPTATVPPTYNPAAEQVVTLSQWVRNGATPIFTYYTGTYPADPSGNPLSTPAPLTQVRLVKVYLKINVNPVVAPKNFELETFAHLRNLKDNL
jgi:prepilin-type N-terminal cleavage/methylation domain-containing protein